MFSYHLTGGIDIFARQNLASNYISYDSQTIGPICALALRSPKSHFSRVIHSITKITLPFQYNNCQFSNNAPATGLLPGTGVNPGNEGGPGNTDTTVNFPNGCYADGEASLAVRKELAQGAVNVSMLGYTVSYNFLDNNRNPGSGLYAVTQAGFCRRRRRGFHPHGRRNPQLL